MQPTRQSIITVSDHLGTSQLILDDQGNIVWQANTLPFGSLDVIIDLLPNHFRFPGQLFDNETGLYYNWHRYYDPDIGRYISADPIGLAGGMNLYAYVGNDPVDLVDPWGLTLDSPSAPPRKNPSWYRYPKRSGEIIFHCGYECYLEKRNPEDIDNAQCVNDPIGESCYDENEQLVDDTHPYSGCKGTPDYWPASYFPVEHTIFDKGGPRYEGWRGFTESNRHSRDQLPTIVAP